MKKAAYGVFMLLILSAAGLAAEPTKEVAVIARQYEYLPGVIDVVKGQPLRLYLTSLDFMHGLFIEKFQIIQRIDKGKLTVVDFVPDQAGTFDFKCSVVCGSGHKEMIGKLVVHEPMMDHDMGKDMSKEEMRQDMPMMMHMH
jgi:cytochrome c oxidase subunit 2